MFLGSTDNCDHLSPLDIIIRRSIIYNALRTLFEEITTLLTQYPVGTILRYECNLSQMNLRMTFGSIPPNGIRSSREPKRQTALSLIWQQWESLPILTICCKLSPCPILKFQTYAAYSKLASSRLAFNSHQMLKCAPRI